MSVRNIGIISDSTLETEKQLNSIRKSSFYQVRNIKPTQEYPKQFQYPNLHEL